MTTDTPATVQLTTKIGCIVHDGPGFSFPVSFVMEAGTTASYYVAPVIGESIEGDYKWMRLADERNPGFVHRSLLRPAT